MEETPGVAVFGFGRCSTFGAELDGKLTWVVVSRVVSAMWSVEAGLLVLCEVAVVCCVGL